ncbi:hypothetical protein BV898_11046 [Hypsibius exemplaris]|uniref:Uncharacterized protein n=1 Tax=Hypsibius exemplaris TaxID=2072580 RepID=A0A1W0WI38_HYPEX|nr:hypothetical protein BV898_11046 [Hypsibius exemplaris]
MLTSVFASEVRNPHGEVTTVARLSVCLTILVYGTENHDGATATTVQRKQKSKQANASSVECTSIPIHRPHSTIITESQNSLHLRQRKNRSPIFATIFARHSPRPPKQELVGPSSSSPSSSCSPSEAFCPRVATALTDKTLPTKKASGPLPVGIPLSSRADCQFRLLLRFPRAAA